MTSELIVQKPTCEQCRKKYEAPNPPQPHQRFCTAACRLKAWRKKRKKSKC